MSDIHVILNLYLEAIQWKVALSNQRNNTGVFYGLVHLYYMKSLDFCGLIKHIDKTSFQNDKIACAKDFISVHMKTQAFTCIPEIWDKKEIALV